MMYLAALSSQDEELVSRERLGVASELAQLPDDADALASWFKRLLETGPGQKDALFPWLAEKASLAELRWFLREELACKDACDLLSEARRQEGSPRPALELDGHLRDAELLPESAALANLLSALAWNRRYALQSLGAWGALDLVSPGRAALVGAGLRRLGEGPRGGPSTGGATLQLAQAQSWDQEVLRPLMAANPHCGHALAEGALMSLTADARCLAAYRAHLGSH